MPDPPDEYAIQFSEPARASKKDLPPDAALALLDVVVALAADPNAFPNRTQALSRDGKIRVYYHPSPPLQVTFEVDESRHVLYLEHFVAPRVPITKPIFISYSHKDAKWLEKLKQFLLPLEQQGFISVWDDTEIRPGAAWLDEIRDAIGLARVAVFLVSQDFVNSPFINEKELPALIEAATGRGCLIFWIAVSSSTFEATPLAKYQAASSTPLDLMSEAEQNKVLADISRKLKAAISQ